MKPNSPERMAPVPREERAGSAGQAQRLACATLLLSACAVAPAQERGEAPVDDVRVRVTSMSIDGAAPCAWPLTRNEGPVSSWNLDYYPVAEASVHEYSEFSHWCWPVIATWSDESLESAGQADADRYLGAYQLEPGAIITVGSAAGFSARAWAQRVAGETPNGEPGGRPVLMLVFGSPAAPDVGVVREDVGNAGPSRVVMIWVTDPSDLAWRNWHPLGPSRTGEDACVPYRGAAPCEGGPPALEAHVGYDEVDLERVIDSVSRNHDLSWAKTTPLLLGRLPDDLWEPNDDPSHARTIADGDLVEGNIDPAYDEDWFVLEIDRARTVRIETSDGAGGCAFDSVLSIYDSAVDDPGGENCVHEGSALGCDDDDGVRTCSALEYRASRAGEYVVRLVSYGHREMGSYAMSVSIW